MAATLSHPQVSSPQVAIAQPRRIVAIGDSLIYGYGDPEGGGWVERLRRRWFCPETPGHVLYNLGVRGDGVQRVSQRLNYEFSRRGELRNRLPDLVILSVGVNDSARVGKPNGRHHTDFAVFQAQMADLLDQAQDLGPVLFVGMVPVLPERMPFAEVLYYNHTDQGRYRDITAAACDQRQIPYLDVLDLWLGRGDAWWRPRLSGDGLHPNVEGYRALLEDITQWSAFQHLL
ncbi:GDSL-type esterase/lipase family protein [Leptolyngbya sp. PCC 6406]|uniref:GDSL-type esterase/lipase family protein n=1 Tax=Leptolyngbya sp. PCC 6406 TaxID=1173264 RepID=UPI000308BF49|nr:GDSL-type esterase/lipase family protein [Leptolyngbya sp. PCC 6406]